MMVARITEGSGPTTAANPSTVTMAPARPPGAAPGPAQQRPHGRRDERDVEAGDREHVVDAGAAERRIDVGGQIGAVTEEKPGEQRGRGRRQRLTHCRQRLTSNRTGQRGASGSSGRIRSPRAEPTTAMPWRIRNSP